jgi:hypothetical protein
MHVNEYLRRRLRQPAFLRQFALLLCIAPPLTVAILHGAAAQAPASLGATGGAGVQPVSPPATAPGPAPASATPPSDAGIQPTSPATTQPSTTGIPAAPPPTPVTVPPASTAPAPSDTGVQPVAPPATQPLTGTPAAPTSTPVAAPAIAAPVPAAPPAAVAPPQVVDWPAGNAHSLIYRMAPASMGDADGVSLWVRDDGAAITLRVRLMTIDPATVTPDTVMIRPMWISYPILVQSKSWRQVVLPRSAFTLHRLGDAPDGIDPALPADAQGNIQPTEDQPKFDDANAIALEVAVAWHSTIGVDDIAWAHIDSTGAVMSTQTIDNFETGNVAAWTTLGDYDHRYQTTYGIITKPAWVHGGRVAFKMNIISPAARRKGLLLPGVNRVMAMTHQPYLVFAPASLFAKVVPSTLPEPGGSSSSVSVTVCPQQIQAATFCLYSRVAMKDVTVTMSDDLFGTGHILPKDSVDIKVVKVWNRLGIGPLRNPDDAGPAPELLVKDDRINLSGPAPVIPLTGDPVTDIQADSTKQFWLTVSVPRGTPADDYNGKVILKPAGMAPISVPIDVNVLALRLLDADKQYAIDLRSRLDPAPATLPQGDGSAFVTDFVTPDMLNKQLADIAAHGVRYVSIHDPDSTVWDAYNARAAAGFLPPFIYSGPSDPLRIETERSAHQAPEFLYYEQPNADGQIELAMLAKKQIPTTTYIAHPADYDALQDDLDTVIYDRDEDYPEQLVRTHGLRTSMKHDWWYWPATNNDPHANRYSSGYLLQRAHLYGAFLPAYQIAFGTDPYDEMSVGAPAGYGQYRPEMLAYPAAGGVIDTVQWEAVREGINDERYLTTLYTALRECKDAHIEKALTAEAEAYVRSFLDQPLALLSDADYDTARAKIAGYALTLRTAADAYAKSQLRQ